MSNEHRRVHLVTLLLIVTLAAIFRAAVATPEACLSRDGVWFVEMAKKLGDDPVRQMRIETKQPGFSWVLLAAHAIGGGDTPEDWQATGTVLAGIGGVAVCGLVYFIALRLFDRKVAAVAGVFAAFWPQGVQLSADVLSDMPHLAIYLGAIALIAAGPEKRALLRWPAAGLLIGVAYWFRLEALGFLPAVVIWTVVAWPRAQWRRAIAPVALFLLAFGVVAGPFVLLARWPRGQATASGAPCRPSRSACRVAWRANGECRGAIDVVSFVSQPRESAAPSGRNQEEDATRSTGFVPTAARSPLHPWLHPFAPSAVENCVALAGLESQNGIHIPGLRSNRFAVSDPPRAPIGRSFRAVSCTASGLQLANPVAPLKLPGRMAEEWAKSGRYVFAVLFLAALFIKSTPRGARPLTWLCALAAVFQLLLVAARVLTYGELSSRYMLVPIALTIPWAAAGFVHLVELAIQRSSDTSRYKFIPIWTTGFMLALAPMVYYAVQPIHADRLSLRHAGAWLRMHAAGDVILADGQNLSQVQYYADRRYPNAGKWQHLARDAGDAARNEAVRRIRPAWFVSMIDEPHKKVDAKARAKALCDELAGYEVAKIFDTGARPVIVLRRSGTG